MKKAAIGEEQVRGSLCVVGLGPGPAELCTQRALARIRRARLVVGGRRNLDALGPALGGKETLAVGHDLDALLADLTGRDGQDHVAVVVSGDPGLYSLLGFLHGHAASLPEPWRDFEVVPGISALQYFCARLRCGWHDLAIASVHGRTDPELAGRARAAGRLAIFTGGEDGPAAVCRTLAEAGLGDWQAMVGERLAYPEERIVRDRVDGLMDARFDSLSLMIVEAPDHVPAETSGPAGQTAVSKPPVAAYPAIGIPDADFLRGDIPMTKEDIRILSLSRLRLLPDSVVWDIGAGTGSVAVECGRQCPAGEVWAVEREAEGVALIRANASRFNLSKLRVVHGEAPAALAGLPAPDRVFIGGSGGNMDELLALVAAFRPRPRVVINTVTIESAAEALAALKRLGFGGIDIRQIAVSRGESLGGKHLLRAQNPVCIISADGSAS